MTLDYQARQGRTSWEDWEINHPQITQITQIFPTKMPSNTVKLNLRNLRMISFCQPKYHRS